MEKIWFVFPLVGLLSQLGGTYKKQFRRIGIPSLIVLVSIMTHGWSWWLPVLWGCIFGATTLPFTLIGDGISDSWFNYLWIFIWGAIISLSGIVGCLYLGHISYYLYACILSTVVIGCSALLSNIPAVRTFFPWKFCEAVMWSMAMYPILLILTF